jgi:DNA mismatch repair ATPase MutS
MKAYLMYRDRDFDPAQDPPPCVGALVQDLELTTLFGAMSGGDKVLADVAYKAVVASSVDIDTILYRQASLKDCLRNASVVRELYDIAVETKAAEQKHYYLGRLGRFPSLTLSRSIDVLEMLVRTLARLRRIADEHAASFESAGFSTLFAMLRAELADDYFGTIRRHLRQLKFNDGVLISAHLGEGNNGTDYVLREEPPTENSWIRWIFAAGPPAYSYRVPDRDEGGARALSGLRDQGINLVANALAQSTDHIVSFFNMLGTELAFYVGCLNLHDRLSELGESTCFPQPTAPDEHPYSASGLYDVCLALTLGRTVVSNDVNADDKALVIVTGANEGGKSTFLRSVGLSQLMMQCGMFVPAQALRASLCARIFTHYKREEDVTMESGKFDEELKRMSAIVDHLIPNSLVLFNESFAATNEREGSEIARQIVTALIERRVKTFFVTHQYEFARGFCAADLPTVLFLRAEREADGTRTFRITEGEPLPTSYGEDLYRQIFTGAGAT